MSLRRPIAALLAPLAFLAAAGEADAADPPQDRPSLAVPRAADVVDEQDAAERERRFRAQESALDEDGMLAAVNMGAGARIGIGRFTVPELARPRTWMERDADRMDVRPNTRGIAAVGVRLPF